VGGRGEEFSGSRKRRRIEVWGRGPRRIGCLREKDLGRGTLEAKRGTRLQLPKCLYIWDFRPLVGLATKIIKISEDIKVESAL
jgi:hypothetical protein